MIKKITLKNFKRFSNNTITLRPNCIQVVAGGNNAGKSSVLHAFALWEYCKTLHYFERGENYFNTRTGGIGINVNDFTPINLPSLKYLWTSLSTGTTYNLKLKVYWEDIENTEYYLEFALAYAQERVYVKVGEHNLNENTKIPKVAYLPPFAGIKDKETWYSKADRKKMIGQGLAGSVLRNLIIDLYTQSLETRKNLLAGRTRLKDNDWQCLKEKDPFEILNRTINRVFKAYLIPKTFNPEFHTYLTVNLSKGTIPKNRLLKEKGFSRRDIMVEGSGFLQWLMVFVFTLEKDIDTLLLDEPDAHLHTDLEKELFKELDAISKNTNKQILFATHSPEIIKTTAHNHILKIDKGNADFLTTERQKVMLLSGLGSEYNPLFDKINKCKRVLFVEGESDEKILKSWAENLKVDWPKNLVVWAAAKGHKDRKHLFLYLKDHIEELKCISLVDRDNGAYNETNSNLSEKYDDLSEKDKKMEFRHRKWRRCEIENYLICPNVIAKVANVELKSVEDFIFETFSFKVCSFLDSDRNNANGSLFDREGKEILDSICNHFKITKFQIASAMEEEEIPEDPVTLLREIVDLCQ